MKCLTKIFIILFLMGSGLSLSGQGNLMFANAEDYDEDRYEDYSGSPYYFDNWVIGDIYSQSGEIFKNMILNYNIDDQLFEVRNEKKYIVLDPAFYWCVKVYKDINKSFLDKNAPDSTLFIRGILPDAENKFVEVIYNGSRVKLVRELYIATSTKKFNDVGRTITMKRFNRKDKHFLIIDGEYDDVKLKDKDIMKALGKRDELKKWAKENDIKVKNDQDFAKMLKYYEETLMN